MRVTTLKGEKTLAELVDRLFEIKKKTEPEARAAAEAELLRINPHLRALGKVPSGLPILVPDLKEAGPGAAGDPLTSRFGAVLNQVQNAFLAARETVETSTTDTHKEVQTSLSQLKSKEFKAAVGDEPNAKKAILAITAELEKRSKQSADLKKFQGTAFNALVRDLAQLGEFASRIAARAISSQGVSTLVRQVKNAKAGEKAKAAEPAKPADKGKEPAKPVDTGKPAEVAKPAQPARPAEPAKPVVSGPLKPIVTATINGAKKKSTKSKKAGKSGKSSKKASKKKASKKKASKATKTSKKG
jgi:hypothetical protein